MIVRSAPPFPRLELIFLFQVTGDRELLRSDQAAAEQNYFCNCSIKKRARVSLRTAKFNCPVRLGRGLKRRGRCGQGRNALNSVGGDEKLRIVSVLQLKIDHPPLLMWVRTTLRRYNAVSVVGAKNGPRCPKSAVPFENKLCVCIFGVDAHDDGPLLASVWLGRNVRFDKGTN